MTRGILYTSYFAKFKKGIGNKISIARMNPQFININQFSGWCRSLSPSVELLNDYKYKDLSWEDYTKRYYSEVENSITAQVNIKNICESLMDGKSSTLYCYEKSSDNCHRHLLAEIFRDRGFEVKEIE